MKRRWNLLRSSPCHYRAIWRRRVIQDDQAESDCIAWKRAEDLRDGGEDVSGRAHTTANDQYKDEGEEVRDPVQLDHQLELVSLVLMCGLLPLGLQLSWWLVYFHRCRHIDCWYYRLRTCWLHLRCYLPGFQYPQHPPTHSSGQHHHNH